MAEGAAKRLVEANLALVVAIARRHANEKIHILDLIQHGNNGLLQAARSLSGSAPGSFSDYATDYIERAIRDAGKTVFSKKT